MKIIPQSVHLDPDYTPNPERLIERVGRICYKSEEKITPESTGPFVRKLVALGHESVFEHPSATLIFVSSRGMSHEAVWQRPTIFDDVPDGCESTWLKGLSQESTRYCNYSGARFGNEITVIEPPGLGDGRAAWILAMGEAEHRYFQLLGAGVKPEIARGVLPIDLKTEWACTANFHSWRVILRQRWCNPKAHPQMRLLMANARDALMSIAPNVFGDLVGDSPCPPKQ